MAAMNSSVLACNYAVCGAGMSELANARTTCMPSVVSAAQTKVLGIRTQQPSTQNNQAARRRAALLSLAAVAFTAVSSNSAANAGVIDENSKKAKPARLATSGANFARAFTVQFGSCKFPQNFTGCEDLAKQKKVPFLSDDLSLECEGKDKYNCGSNVFWKW